MSIQHLFTQNTYDLNCNSLTANELSIETLDLDNLDVSNNMTVNNTLTTNILTVNDSATVEENININGALQLSGASTPLSVFQSGVVNIPIGIGSCSATVNQVGQQAGNNYVVFSYVKIGNAVTLQWTEFVYTATNTSNFMLQYVPPNLECIELYDEIASNITPQGQPLAYETLIFHMINPVQAGQQPITISNLDQQEGSTQGTVYTILPGSVSYLSIV